MKLICLLALLALSGCAALDPYKAQAVDVLAKANDRALQDAELIMCRGISVGAWVRAYGTDAKLAEAWRALCGQPVTELPAK